MFDHRLGFTDLTQEVQIDPLPLQGHIPEWLNGTLIRNGPAKFSLNKTVKYNHWFDGLAMLHRFRIQGGQVAYSNRFVRSEKYLRDHANQKVTFREFATDPDWSRLEQIITLYRRNFSDNTSINVIKLDRHMLALTESPRAITFDPDTLEALRHYTFQDRILPDGITTAHPHIDHHRGEVINFATRFKLPRPSYRLYHHHIKYNKRGLLADFPVNQVAYMHSFGLTENTIILVEPPLLANIWSLGFSPKPFIENYQWKPERGTRFLLFECHTGKHLGIYETEAFFTYHHINAYEQKNTLMIDLVAYPDSSSIQGLYIDTVRQTQNYPLTGKVQRTCIDLKSGKLITEQRSDAVIELPRINDRLNMQPYHFVYGVGLNPQDKRGFGNQLVKINVRTGKTIAWYTPNTYPGEAVFVPSKNSQAEDDGLLLSVVLDSVAGSSFLLVLNARTMQEIARATLPHHIPFGFHGQFFSLK